MRNILMWGGMHEACSCNPCIKLKEQNIESFNWLILGYLKNGVITHHNYFFLAHKITSCI